MISPTWQQAPRAAPAPGIIHPVHCQGTLISPSRHAAGERPHAPSARDLSNDARNEALAGPQLGDQSTQFGQNWLDQATHFLTSAIFTPDPAQAPWGLDLRRPTAARTGLVRLRPDPARIANSGAPTRLVSTRQLAQQFASPANDPDNAMQVTVREEIRAALPYNRFLFTTTALAGFFGGLAAVAPVLAAIGGAALFTNAALNVGVAREDAWARQLPPCEVEALLANERRWQQRLLRWINVWPLAPQWLQPHIPIDGTLRALRAPGDWHRWREQTSFGWNLALILPFLVRIGWQSSRAGGNALGAERRDANTMALSLTLGSRLHSGSWLRAGPLWASGHRGHGDRHARTARATVPWPSAEGALAWVLLADTFARAARQRRYWPLTQLESQVDLPASFARRVDDEAEHVHSRGQSEHLSWLSMPIEGHVAQVGWIHHTHAGACPGHALVLRGLAEDLRYGFRYSWQCALSFPPADAAPAGARGAVQYTALLSQATERNLAPFAARVVAALGPAPTAASRRAQADAARQPDATVSDDSSSNSSSSREFISFPAYVSSQTRTPSDTPAPAATAVPPQTSFYLQVTRTFVMPTRRALRSDGPSDRMAALLHTVAVDPTPSDRQALQDAVVPAGANAFAAINRGLAQAQLSTHCHVTSQTRETLTVIAQRTRIAQAAAQVANHEGTPLLGEADPALLTQLSDHARFWQQLDRFPADIAQAGQDRSAELLALRRVLAPRVAEL